MTDVMPSWHSLLRMLPWKKFGRARADKLFVCAHTVPENARKIEIAVRFGGKSLI